MINLLGIVSGLAWLIAYVDGARVGFRDKTYAIPMAALMLNFAWETTYSVHDILTRISGQTVINVLWTAADTFIIYTFFKYGRNELPKFITKQLFILWTIVLITTAYTLQWMFVKQFSWAHGSEYSAFLQNLLMSGLFIAMLSARHGVRGQTMLIAVAKWIGTLAPTLAIGLYGHSTFILGVGALCSIFDLIYIYLVWRAQRNPSRPALTSTIAN